MNKKPGTSKDAADKLVKNIRRKTRLKCHSVSAGLLDRGHGFLGISLAAVAVVVDGYGLCALFGEVTGQEASKVLCTTCNKNNFAFNTVSGLLASPIVR